MRGLARGIRLFLEDMKFGFSFFSEIGNLKLWKSFVLPNHTFFNPEELPQRAYDGSEC